MDHSEPQEQRSPNSQLVFFKNFISVNSNTSGKSNLMLERRLQKPQRSHIALKKVLNTIDNNYTVTEMNEGYCQLRRSVTSQAKRTKAEQTIINNEFSVPMRTICRRPVEGQRSKTVGKCNRIEDDNKFSKIGQVNKIFKQRKQNSFKQRPANGFYRSLVQDKSNDIKFDLKLESKLNVVRPKIKTMPLQAKHKSSGHLAPMLNNTPFQISESSQILISNLLNPEPEGRNIRKDSSDSTKRFYLKLKRKKEGSLWKPLKEELALLDSESVSKQIPSQLGIYKIKLPKRNYRHQFLQNIQKIKESYLRIKGNGQNVKQKLKRAPTKTFQRTVNARPIDRKMYEIKYKAASKEQEKQLIRSKTQFFQSRSQWEAFVSNPLEPWETEENYRFL